MLKTLYYGKKMLFILALIAILLFVVGCSAQGGSTPPPSGPIGGGCG